MIITLSLLSHSPNNKVPIYKVHLCSHNQLKNYFSFRCMPLSTSSICSIGIESYAIKVAQDERVIAIADVIRNARSAVLNSDIDPVCITLLDIVNCFYTFPPCLDFKLLLPCASVCVELVEYYTLCFAKVAKHIRDKTVSDHFLRFNCHAAESYYIGHDERLFQLDDEICLKIPYGQFNYIYVCCLNLRRLEKLFLKAQELKSNA